MSIRPRAAVAVWRARTTRTTSDRGYAVYLSLLLVLVAVAPLARAVWLSATSAETIALLTSPAAPAVTVFVVACLWAGGLLLGRDRGPALFPAVLTHALATSDLPRSDAFRGPLIRSGALVTTATTILAGLVAGSQMTRGLAEPLDVTIFTVTGGLVGAIATVAWLAGQALPRAAVPIAFGVIVLGATTAVIPALQPFLPWGWAGLTYAGGLSLAPVAALTATTVALVALVPALMDRLDHADLMAQAARWESATIHAASMELSTAVAVYGRRPHVGRGLRAVRPMRSMTMTFLIRDAIGAARTPGRVILGVVALAVAGALITFAFTPGTPGWLFGAIAGVTLFAGLGPLTDGARHAAAAAADLPLYGISDERLLAHHLLFPVAVTVIVLLAVVCACSMAIGIAAAAPLLGSLALCMLTVIARIGSAVKGPLPPALLAPIPTPAGDLSAALRLTWALDVILAAAVAGASAALMFQAPAVLIGATVVLIGGGLSRWRHRR